ncbi:TetR/AcrR family transcriptional regulator [Georgenia alba]|uniref:TetR/AcrR family transcriptional regulator n=1 Tax=Georgenia alba TaxID=2233858 RepID=A0ABW2Q3D8_9MICO
MTEAAATPSARKTELLEKCYAYALTHGLSDLSLRPLASAVGSSPRVLLFLFGSKDGLVRALLERARAEELAAIASLHPSDDGAAGGLEAVVRHIWAWLAAPSHRPLLTLWLEGYSRSLLGEPGPWAGFARSTVEDWLDLLAAHQAPGERGTAEGLARRTAGLAILRGALVDLLATDDVERATAAVDAVLEVTRESGD